MRGIVRKALYVALPAMLFLVSACASSVTRSPDTASTAPILLGEDQRAGQVTVSLTPAAQELAADNLTFDQNELLATVRRALQARDAMASEPDASLPSVEIVVTDFRTRSAFSAVMFGFLAGDDHITGDVVLRSPTGEELQRFSVSASYALGGLGGGMNDTRMGWLYERFAEHVLDELTGTQTEGTKAEPAQPG
jgi:hypothetical protein